MDIQEVYLTFNRKLNRLSTNHRKNISFPIFVNLFNEAQIRWAKDILRVEDGTDVLLEDLQVLLKPYKKKPFKDKDYYVIDLPSDYFHFKRSWSQARQGECTGRIWNQLVESSHLDHYLRDPYYTPSFEWEETLLTIEGDKLRVYYDGFEIDLIELTYYMVPPKVDIAGYVGFNGSSQNIDPIFSDRATLDIISKAVTLIAGDIGDVDTYQIKAQEV